MIFTSILGADRSTPPAATSQGSGAYESPPRWHPTKGSDGFWTKKAGCEDVEVCGVMDWCAKPWQIFADDEWFVMLSKVGTKMFAFHSCLKSTPGGKSLKDWPYLFLLIPHSSIKLNIVWRVGQGVMVCWQFFIYWASPNIANWITVLWGCWKLSDLLL